MRLDGFGLLVSDMGTMIRFYRDVLGFEIREAEDAENVYLVKDGTLFLLYGRKDFAKYLPMFYYDVTLVTDEVVDQYYSTCDDHASRQAIMYAIRNFDEEYAFEEIRKAKREYFIIWGEEDRLQPMDRLFEIRKILPDSVYHSIRNTGHWMHEEKGAQIAEAVDRYIRYTGEEA